MLSISKLLNVLYKLKGGFIVEIVQAESKKWIILDNQNILAEIYLDPWYQVTELVIRSKDDKVQREVKELTASHVAQYIRKRRFSSELIKSENFDSSLTQAESYSLLDFDKILDSIKEMSDERLERALGGPVNIVYAKYKSFWTLLMRAVIPAMKRQHGISLKCRIESHVADDSVNVFFDIVDDDQLFRFWRTILGKSLHIIPPYHPSVIGMESVGCINGDTAAYIGRSSWGISYVYSPSELTPIAGFRSNWHVMKHPYYTEGKSFCVCLLKNECLSSGSYRILMNLLLAALGRNNTYVEVSGGFRSPYPYPPRSGKRIDRGSESSCIWEYRTLKEEGKLDEAEIPDWFLLEGWPEKYRKLNI